MGLKASCLIHGHVGLSGIAGLSPYLWPEGQNAESLCSCGRLGTYHGLLAPKTAPSKPKKVFGLVSCLRPLSIAINHTSPSAAYRRALRRAPEGSRTGNRSDPWQSRFGPRGRVSGCWLLGVTSGGPVASRGCSVLQGKLPRYKENRGKHYVYIYIYIHTSGYI